MKNTVVSTLTHVIESSHALQSLSIHVVGHHKVPTCLLRAALSSLCPRHTMCTDHDAPQFPPPPSPLVSAGLKGESCNSHFHTLSTENPVVGVEALIQRAGASHADSGMGVTRERAFVRSVDAEFWASGLSVSFARYTNWTRACAPR